MEGMSLTIATIVFNNNFLRKLLNMFLKKFHFLVKPGLTSVYVLKFTT